MKMKLALASLTAALMQVTHAFALPVTVTYSGVVAAIQDVNGIAEPAPDVDVANLFGGGNLEGDLISASFAYDTSLGVDLAQSGSDELVGGTSYFASSPITSTTFSILAPGATSAYSYSYVPNFAASVFTGANEPNTGVNGLSATAFSTSGDTSLVYIGTKTPAPTNLASAFSAPGYGPGSYFLPAVTKTGAQDSIVFDALEVMVSPAPEPSDWTLMILGIGLVGGVLRGCRRGREEKSVRHYRSYQAIGLGHRLIMAEPDAG